MSKTLSHGGSPIIGIGIKPRTSRVHHSPAFSIVLITSIIFTATSFWHKNHVETASTVHDPASEWQDNVFPFREQTPWDVSTDFPYERVLEYDVEEGTWLRLDVHPKTGDVVFDMLGDLYCIPGSETLLESDSESVARARPILLGIPHDADPRFSPNGTILAFRSDAGLGVDNIWVMEWTSCAEMDRRPLKADGSLAEALSQKEVEDDLIVRGIPETRTRRMNRLAREGRLGAQRVTNETFRYVSNPRFHPSENKIITSKWYTSKITIAASEGWEYPLRSFSAAQEPASIAPGGGRRVLGRTLPRGMTVDDYADQQVGPEQFNWAGDDMVIFAKNVVDEYVTSVKDIHKGAFAIFSRNLTTGKEETLVDAFPGGASRPEISRDGRSLAFVRHVGDHEVLALKDLHSGTLRYIWHGLTYDFSVLNPGLGGTYPSFAFSPNDDAIIIWAQGQIYRVPLTTNALGEKIAIGEPKPIRFRAHIEKRIADTLKGGVDLLGIETQDTQRVHALKELSLDDSGSRAVFQAAGVSVVQVFEERAAMKVPVVVSEAAYYSPSFVPGVNQFVIHARWSDIKFTTFELADLDLGVAYELSGVPLGRYFSPVVSEAPGSSRRIAFVKSTGDLLTGHVLATSRPGLYIGDIELPLGTRARSVPIRNLQLIPSEVDSSDPALRIRFLGSTRLLVQQSSRVFTLEFDGERVDQHLVVTGKMTNEIAVVPQLLISSERTTVENVAFVEYQHVYFASRRGFKDGNALWAKPGNSTTGLMRLSVDGGHSLAWSRDGTRLSWLQGPAIHSLDVSNIRRCDDAARKDRDTFGIKCTQDLIEQQQIFVEHSTDIFRLKTDAKLRRTSQGPDHDTVVAIHNATLLTMATGEVSEDLITDGVMLVQGGVILAVGAKDQVLIPASAELIDALGGYLIPGFIDVHAHWSGYTVRYPAKSWEMQTFLAYGVTTLHNPSSDTVNTFSERSRLESGYFVGPRILTTGTVLFAGTWIGMHEEIVDEDQARAALNRIKAEGGPTALSYKNYQLPSRASRQRLFKTARDLKMLCFPEGGANYDWDLTYIIDGMTSLEHSLPFAVLYEDVAKLFVQSGTGYTPTYVVNYAGPWGEEYVWANDDIPNDPKLQTFLPQSILEGLTESVARPSSSYVLFNASSYAAKMAHMGLKVHIGAHGEQPMGLNYHAEMFFTRSGGLSNYEVLQAATSDAAATLGIYQSLGTLSAGKLADFLIYAPGVDLLKGPIRDTTKLRYVARGGRIWDATTMIEVWPVTGRKEEMPLFNT